MAVTIREEMERDLAGMVATRAPFEQDWEEIGRLTLPSRLDFIGAKTTSVGMNGQITLGGASASQMRRRANTKVADSRGGRAARRLQHGMHSGLSPSSSPWFKLVTRDREMLEFQSVKEHLAIVERAIYKLFADIGIYDTFKVNYGDLGTFGFGAGVLAEHRDYIAVSHDLAIGECWTSLDDGMRADKLKRRVDLTVYQMHQMFPLDRLSQACKNAYNNNRMTSLVPCFHAIHRNPDYDPNVKFGLRSFKYRSVWWEQGQSNKDILLRVSGYTTKNFWAPRWETRGSMVYCDSAPGFNALPDLREAQLLARKRGQTRDILVAPPLKAPSGLANTLLRLDAKSITYAAATDLEGLAPIFRTQYNDVVVLRDDHNEIGQTINEHFFTDLFMAITQREGVQPLNDLETSLRDAEKYTQLGPVVDRVNVEMLEVAVHRAYEILDMNGMLPPPPKELEGEPLVINFVSMLAQAQKSAENAAIERTARFVGFIAGLFPDAAVKFDAQQAIDEFATGTGTPPRIIRSDEVVEKLVAEQQQQAQAQQAAMMAKPAADGAAAAELLSRTQIDPQGRTALQAMLQQ